MKKSKLFQSWGTFRKGLDAQSIQLSFASHLEYSLSKDQHTSTNRDLYLSLALSARDRLIERWIKTQQKYYTHDVKRVYYLSAEYLMGRVLVNNLINLNMYAESRKAMEELSIEVEELAAEEPDMGLGNGGLGRLAACFLDSLATLEVPAIGYGIRYEFGIFDQTIKDGWQVEITDKWLRFGNPWEIGVYKPFERESEYLEMLYFRQACGVASSATDRRRWTQDGQTCIQLVLAVPAPNYEALHQAILDLGTLDSERVSGEWVSSRYGNDWSVYSEITVTFYPRSTVRPLISTTGWSPVHTLERAWRVFVTIFGFVVDILIWVTVLVGPFILMGLGLWAVIRKLRPAR